MKRNNKPHYYKETTPYRGCGVCGYGSGALVHNTFEVERYNLKRLDEAKEVGRCHECGDYYAIDANWADTITCSKECADKYIIYLNNSIRGL